MHKSYEEGINNEVKAIKFNAHFKRFLKEYCMLWLKFIHKKADDQT
jgi:hypothetical protein